MDKYEIQPHNIYNLDKKYFLIRILTKLRRIFAKLQQEQGKLIKAGQDSNQEWITVLACIYTDGTALSPGLIYQASTGNIQDSWLQDFDPQLHKAFFASSPTGWTNDELGY